MRCVLSILLALVTLGGSAQPALALARMADMHHCAPPAQAAPSCHEHRHAAASGATARAYFNDCGMDCCAKHKGFGKALGADPVSAHVVNQGPHLGAIAAASATFQAVALPYLERGPPARG